MKRKGMYSVGVWSPKYYDPKGFPQEIMDWIPLKLMRNSFDRKRPRMLFMVFFVILSSRMTPFSFVPPSSPSISSNDQSIKSIPHVEKEVKRHGSIMRWAAKGRTAYSLAQALPHEWRGKIQGLFASRFIDYFVFVSAACTYVNAGLRCTDDLDRWGLVQLTTRSKQASKQTETSTYPSHASSALSLSLMRCMPLPSLSHA